MRDPNRIPSVCNQLAEQWARVPDWRLGQLFNNLQRYYRNDLFYMDDAAMIEKIKHFLDESLGPHTDPQTQEADQ